MGEGEEGGGGGGMKGFRFELLNSALTASQGCFFPSVFIE